MKSSGEKCSSIGNFLNPFTWMLHRFDPSWKVFKAFLKMKPYNAIMALAMTIATLADVASGAPAHQTSELSSPDLNSTTQTSEVNPRASPSQEQQQSGLQSRGCETFAPPPPYIVTTIITTISTLHPGPTKSANQSNHANPTKHTSPSKSAETSQAKGQSKHASPATNTSPPSRMKSEEWIYASGIPPMKVPKGWRPQVDYDTNENPLPPIDWKSKPVEVLDKSPEASNKPKSSKTSEKPQRPERKVDKRTAAEQRNSDFQPQASQDQDGHLNDPVSSVSSRDVSHGSQVPGRKEIWWKTSWFGSATTLFHIFRDPKTTEERWKRSVLSAGKKGHKHKRPKWPWLNMGIDPPWWEPLGPGVRCNGDTKKKEEKKDDDFWAII